MNFFKKAVISLKFRLSPFLAKLIGKEPYASWGGLFKEHCIDYLRGKIMRTPKGEDDIPCLEEAYDDVKKIVSINGYKVFWPKNADKRIVFDGFRATFCPDEPDCYFRFYEPDSADIVFDLGACEGFFTLALQGKVEKVYAFEAFPVLCDMLSSTFTEDIARDKVEVCNYAVGNREGTVDFFVLDSLNASTAEAPKAQEDSVIEQCAVPAITLDKFVEDHAIKKVSMIKMDVEGAEYSVLEGARKVLRELKPDLLVSAYHYPRDYDRLTKFLVDAGYSIRKSPLVMTDQGGQKRPWYRYALIYATVENNGDCVF